MALWRTAARKWEWISNGLHNREPIPDTCHLHCGGQMLLVASLSSSLFALSTHHTCVLSSHRGAIWAKLSFNIKDLTACLEIFNPVFVGLAFNICTNKNQFGTAFNIPSHLEEHFEAQTSSVNWGFNTFFETLMEKKIHPQPQHFWFSPCYFHLNIPFTVLCHFQSCNPDVEIYFFHFFCAQSILHCNILLLTHLKEFQATRLEFRHSETQNEQPAYNLSTYCWTSFIKIQIYIRKLQLCIILIILDFKYQANTTHYRKLNYSWFKFPNNICFQLFE